MKLRRLTSKGIEQFSAFLDSLGDAEQPSVPSWLLEHVDTSTTLQVDINVQDVTFSSRFELAQYIDLLLRDSNLTHLERDVELWTWLALFYFEQLCPPEDDGRREPGERARFIPAIDDYRKYYRHLVAGPCSVFRTHRDDPTRVLAVLAGPVNKPGDIAEQLASRQEIVTNKAAMAVATTLYIDMTTRRPKKGAAGRGPGSARRFADVLNQFDLTWDLYAMEMQSMLLMMPSEFKRFR